MKTFPAFVLRTLGWVGIAILAGLNLFGYAMAVQRADWKGFALMIFLTGLLAVFGRTLQRGARLARHAGPGDPLAQGWEDRPVGAFLREQVAKSMEGRLLIAGSVACLAMAGLALWAPAAVGLAGPRTAAHAAMFGVWPLMAFLGYLRVCGPGFERRVFSTVAVALILAVPFVLAYR
jgi:hypothetical protein